MKKSFDPIPLIIGNVLDIIEQLPVNVYWKDINGILLGCNQNNLDSFNIPSKEEYIGKTDYAFFPKEQADKLVRFDQEVIRTGKTIIDEEVVTKSNNEKAIYLSIKQPLRDRNNIIVGLLGVSIDITESKKNQLKELQVLNTIINLMPGNVYWMDTQGYYLGCNQNQLSSVEFVSSEQFIGKRNVDLSGFIIPEALDPVNKKVMETGKTMILEEPAILSDGSVATYLSNKGPIFNEENEVVGMVGVSFDITERKKQEEEVKRLKEEAEMANRIKTEFIKAMQHDIQTPAAGIYQALQQLKKKENNTGNKQYLEMLSQMSKQLLNLCSSFVESTDAEIGEHPLTVTEIDIRQLARDVLEMNQYAAFNKRLALHLKITERVPQFIKTDSFRLQRILMNLLGNAIKFTEQGKVMLEINCIEEEKKSKLHIIVKDTGIGIAKDKQGIIFDKYSRVVSEDLQYPGFGLGLYIVKKFVDDLLGEIQVKSELLQGTMVSIKLLNDKLKNITEAKIDEVLISPW